MAGSLVMSTADISGGWALGTKWLTLKLCHEAFDCGITSHARTLCFINVTGTPAQTTACESHKPTLYLTATDHLPRGQFGVQLKSLQNDFSRSPVSVSLYRDNQMC